MNTKEDSPMAPLEEAGVAFDPLAQHLDLSKDEKRRTTALMMAVNAYQHLIIKDADYLRTASDLARRDEGPKIKPATIDAMVIAALKFDAFISGNVQASPEQGGGAQANSGGEGEEVTA